MMSVPPVRSFRRKTATKRQGKSVPDEALSQIKTDLLFHIAKAGRYLSGEETPRDYKNTGVPLNHLWFCADRLKHVNRGIRGEGLKKSMAEVMGGLLARHVNTGEKVAWATYETLSFVNRDIRDQWRIYPEAFHLHQAKGFRMATRLMPQAMRENAVLSASGNVYFGAQTENLGFPMAVRGKKGEDLYVVGGFSGGYNALHDELARVTDRDQIRAVTLFADTARTIFRTTDPKKSVALTHAAFNITKGPL